MRARNIAREMILVALVASAITGCSSTPSQSWPDPGSSTAGTGTVPTLQALSALRPGITKQAVRTLMGTPHFSEGFFGVSEWNYLFDINGKACQFRVNFEQEKTKSFTWRTQECASLLG